MDSSTAHPSSQPAFRRFGVLAFGIMIGMVLGSVMPDRPLHATATHGQDSFALATGAVQDGLEGVFFLDYLTGDLKGAVMNLNTRKFAAFYESNVSRDLGGAGSGGAKYLMVTGNADLRSGAMRFRIGSAIIYIMETTTGRLAAYATPWDPARMATGALVKGSFIPLDSVPFRTTPVRP